MNEFVNAEKTSTLKRIHQYPFTKHYSSFLLISKLDALENLASLTLWLETSFAICYKSVSCSRNKTVIFLFELNCEIRETLLFLAALLIIDIVRRNS